jgi:hypothetical protein
MNHGDTEGTELHGEKGEKLNREDRNRDAKTARRTRFSLRLCVNSAFA